MLTGVSPLAHIVFAATTALAVWYIYRSAAASRRVLIITLAWLALITAVGMTGFYARNESMPPNMLWLVGPPFLAIAMLLVRRDGQAFLDGLDLRTLTWLHVIRVPIELVLFWLYEAGKIPHLMTFEGRNPDILSGMTAPLVAWYAFRGAELVRPKMLLAWNLICLALVANIVTHGILSAPTPFQQFAFDQPNTAVFYVPFNWLPGFLVPLVVLAHIASIRRLAVTPLTQQIA